MLSMLLVYDFWNDYLLTPERIAGFSLVVIGIVLALTAKKITRIARKSSTIEKGDKMFASLLTAALVLVLGGMIVAIL